MGLTIHELTEVNLEEKSLKGVFWLNFGITISQ